MYVQSQCLTYAQDMTVLMHIKPPKKVIMSYFVLTIMTVMALNKDMLVLLKGISIEFIMIMMKQKLTSNYQQCDIANDSILFSSNGNYNTLITRNKRSRLSQEKVFKYFFCDNRNEYQVGIFFCSIALIVTEDKCYKKDSTQKQ